MKYFYSAMFGVKLSSLILSVSCTAECLSLTLAPGYLSCRAPDYCAGGGGFSLRPDQHYLLAPLKVLPLL